MPDYEHFHQGMSLRRICSPLGTQEAGEMLCCCCAMAHSHDEVGHFSWTSFKIKTVHSRALTEPVRAREWAWRDLIVQPRRASGYAPLPSA